jgi:hypothetical protein
MASPTKAAGLLGELAVMKAFAGAEPRPTLSIPLGDNAPYDLLVHVGNKFLRVQIKCAALSDDGRHLTSRIARTRYNVDLEKYETIRYEEGTIDVFAVYCQAIDQVYLVPAEEVAGQATVRIALDTERQAGQVVSRLVSFDVAWPQIANGAAHAIRTPPRALEGSRPKKVRIGQSGFFGVSRASSGRHPWEAYVFMGGKKKVYVARGEDPRELAQLHDVKAIELLGPEAVTNRSLGLLDDITSQ